MNLLKGTSNSFKEINPRGRFTPLTEGTSTPITEYDLKDGDTITFSVYIQAHSSVPANARINAYYIGSNRYFGTTGNRIQAGEEGYSTVTYTIPSDIDRLAVGLDVPVPSGDTSIIMHYKEAKLEKATELEPEPEPEPEPEKTLMIPNYNVVNAYVDTSYIPFGSGGVIVSSFSSDGGNKQEIAIDGTLRITANDGYQFDLDNLEEYYFDVQFQPYNYNLRLSYDSSKPFIRVNLSEFRPATGISTFSWLENISSYPLYKSVPTDGTMFYTYSVGDTKHLLLLYGGLRENDLLFFTFTKSKSGNDDIAFTMNGEEWVKTDLFSAKFYDPVADERVEISFLNNLNFVAVTSTDTPIEDTSKYLFNTYYISSSDLSMLRENSGLVSDVIINTYSYPVNFAEDDLVDVTFSVANITQNIPAKRFLFNNTEVEIFKFTIPDIPDVSDIRIRIPFNNDVTLHYEDVRGKTITGRFSYEVLTNSTTLFINDGVSDIYKNMVGVGVVVPYKPTGRFEGGNDPTTRLAVDEPKLFIKGVGKTIKGNYIQGSIGKVVEDMLNSERDKLNTLLQNGVFFND